MSNNSVVFLNSNIFLSKSEVYGFAGKHSPDIFGVNFVAGEL